MEKNENEELLEQSPAEIQQEDTPEIAKSGKEEPDTEEQKVSNGRFILWSLAGVYLLYTSYSLCKGYVTGEDGIYACRNCICSYWCWSAVFRY